MENPWTGSAFGRGSILGTIMFWLVKELINIHGPQHFENRSLGAATITRAQGGPGVYLLTARGTPEYWLLVPFVISVCYTFSMSSI